MSKPCTDFPARNAFGTFFFSGVFVTHSIMLISMLETVSIASFRGSEKEILLTVGLYGFSIATALLCGLCLLSAAYARYYCRIGFLLSLGNVTLLLLNPVRHLETLMLLLADQVMAITLMLGGLGLRFLVPFRLVKAVRVERPPERIVITVPPPVAQPPNECTVEQSLAASIFSTPFASAAPSAPGTPGRPPLSPRAAAVGKPVYFQEASIDSNAASYPTSYRPY